MKKYAIGIMSGTSLDGIDVSLVEISGVKKSTVVKELFSNTYSYESKMIQRIKDAISIDKSTSELLCSLNVELAILYSECVFKLLEECRYSIDNIDFIASHGQTIYHIGTNHGDTVKSSLQLGDGSVLANLTNTTVVSNFRQADIACGGQGAPLVPYADYILFSSDTKTRCMQNIGGISNVTVLPKSEELSDVFAFDNGPGNMMIDYAVKILYGENYDKGGLIAQRGTLIKKMFEEVLSLEFFKVKPPKSTGRELFGNQYTKYLIHKYAASNKEDIIATLTHITAYSIAQSYQKFVLNKYKIDEVLISGGGSHNKTLVQLIKQYLKKEEVFLLDEYGVSSDYKEAIAFVILANETLHRNPSNVKGATGAQREAILGQVSYVIK